MKLKEQIQYQVTQILTELRTNFRWDAFKRAIKDEEGLYYAQKHLKKLGEGSGRRVFLLSNRFVLKIAMNEKGWAQNQAEVDIYTNPHTKPIVAKIYDFDPHYNWLVSELVRPIANKKEFEKHFGVSDEYVDRVIELISYSHGDKSAAKEKAKKDIQRYSAKLEAMELRGEKYDLKRKEFFKEELKFTRDILDAFDKPIVNAILYLQKEFELVSADLTLHKHWGKTAEGRVVLLDYGYTKTVSYTYY